MQSKLHCLHHTLELFMIRPQSRRFYLHGRIKFFYKRMRSPASAGLGTLQAAAQDDTQQKTTMSNFNLSQRVKAATMIDSRVYEMCE